MWVWVCDRVLTDERVVAAQRTAIILDQTQTLVIDGGGTAKLTSKHVYIEL